MINKMNRTGREFPGCPRSEWWVNQCAGLPDAWGPEPTYQRHMGKGENMGHWKENSSFLPLKIGKVANRRFLSPCSTFFFKT